MWSTVTHILYVLVAKGKKVVFHLCKTLMKLKTMTRGVNSRSPRGRDVRCTGSAHNC